MTNHIEMFRRGDGRYFIEIVDNDDYNYVWRSPLYRFFWVAWWQGRRDAKAWLSGQPGAPGQVGLHRQGTFIARMKL